jgi:hypothetical protein
VQTHLDGHEKTSAAGRTANRGESRLGKGAVDVDDEDMFGPVVKQSLRWPLWLGSGWWRGRLSKASAGLPRARSNRADLSLLQSGSRCRRLFWALVLQAERAGLLPTLGGFGRFLGQVVNRGATAGGWPPVHSSLYRSEQLRQAEVFRRRNVAGGAP